jgi:hypothetical protein
VNAATRASLLAAAAGVTAYLYRRLRDRAAGSPGPGAPVTPDVPPREAAGVSAGTGEGADRLPGTGTLTTTSQLVAAGAVAAAGAGLWPGRFAPARAFRTLRGQTVQLYGRGLYRHDTVFVAAGQRATDGVVLTVAVPLLLAAGRIHRRGSLAGHLLLVGTLAAFVYVYGSVALGTVVFNELFLLYVALFSGSLWAFVRAFTSVDRRVLADRLGRAPRRGPAALMLASGGVTAGIWAAPLVAALRRGGIPERLDSYSTPVTQALDLAVVAPAALFAGLRLLRGDPLGYLVASSLLVLEVLLAPLIAAQTASQLAAGIRFPPGQILGPIVGFVALALAAGGALAGVLRDAARVPAPVAT